MAQVGVTHVGPETGKYRELTELKYLLFSKQAQRKIKWLRCNL